MKLQQKLNKNTVQTGRKLPYKILIVGSSGSRKANPLLNLRNHQADIDKIFLYVKDPPKLNYQYLIITRQEVGLKHFNDPVHLIEYWNDMKKVCSNIENYYPRKKQNKKY